MSTPQSPSTGPSPSQVSFPGAEGRIGHRLGAGTIALIVAIIALVVAIVTAVIVFSGSATRPAPPTPHPVVGPSAAAGFTSPGTGPRKFQIVSASTMTPMAMGEVMDLGNGIKMTPAKGWEVTDSGTGWAWLCGPDGCPTELYVSVGLEGTTDIKKAFQTWLNEAPSQFTNFKAGVPQGPDPINNSKNFQQQMSVGFTGDMQGNQGTFSVVGQFTMFFNTSTGNSAFFSCDSVSEEDFDYDLPDVQAMMSSTL